MNSVETGRRAEEHACRYLQQQGLKLVTRNYHSRYGEIDLIMRDGAELVFVEVRYRNQDYYGGALGSITPVKQQRLLVTAEHYIQSHSLKGVSSMRFDVVALSKQEADELQVEWLRNAIQA